MESAPRLLVVDDDPRLLHIVAMYLGMEGFAVETADDGDTALELLSRRSFDLVLLDVMMPRCNGLEVCRRIRSNPSTARLPVLMFTALSADADVERARQAGANHFISKPFSLPGLGNVLRQLFEQARPVTA